MEPPFRPAESQHTVGSDEETQLEFVIPNRSDMTSKFLIYSILVFLERGYPRVGGFTTFPTDSILP